MSDAIKYIDPQEFMEFGYLQEINRQFLHPLGLAFVVTEFDNLTQVADLRQWVLTCVAHDPTVTVESAIDLLLGKLAETGRLIADGQKVVVSGVMDDRGDPQGTWFDWEQMDLDEALRKARNVNAESHRRYQARFDQFGAYRQGVPGLEGG